MNFLFYTNSYYEKIHNERKENQKQRIKNGENIPKNEIIGEYFSEDQ